MKTKITALNATFILAISLLSCGSQSRTATAKKATSASDSSARQAAPNFKLSDLDGKDFALQDYKGKVVLLDFWATWCPPCVMSSPEVEKLNKDYDGKDFAVLSLSLDQSEDPVRSFIKRRGLTNRVAMVKDSGVDTLYDVQGIPSFFLIDKQGRLARRWGGYSPRMPEVWRQEIDELLKT